MIDKEKTKTIILKYLLKHKTVNRKTLIELLNIRPATLFDIINALKENGILVEPDRKTRKTGRKSPSICLNPKSGYYLGIDLEMEHTIGVLIDTSGNVVMKKIIQSLPKKDKKNSIKEIESICKDATAFLGDNAALLKGVGFADAGVVDVDSVASLRAVNISGWEKINLKDVFSKFLGVDCVAYPGASARAFLEYIEFSQDNKGNMFHLELSCGVGGGYINNGNVFIGDSFSGMEVGHIVIKENGSLCQCGNKGCLETIAGAEGLKRSVIKIIDSGVPTLLSKQDFSVDYFVGCVRENDKAACSLAIEVCECIGIALASVVSILNPSVIVFSGSLSGLGDVLTSTVKRILLLRCFPSAVDNTKIYTSLLPKEATAIGAAYLMREKYLLNTSTQ